jgi:hypothetical protein
MHKKVIESSLLLKRLTRCVISLLFNHSRGKVMYENNLIGSYEWEYSSQFGHGTPSSVYSYLNHEYRNEGSSKEKKQIIKENDIKKKKSENGFEDLSSPFIQSFLDYIR